MPRLTKRIVDAAPAKAAPYFVWCSELHGFGVRIYPTGKRIYYADYRSGGGPRRRMAIGAHGKVTTEEARKQALKILGSVVKGDDPAAERATNRKAVTVAELCGAYMDAAERGLILTKRGRPKKANTIATDRGRVAWHIVPLLGSRRVRDLVAADIHRFIRDVADGKTAVVEKTPALRGKAVVTGGLSTAARTVGLLGGILGFAVSEGIRSDNPARGVQRPAGQRRTRRLTSEEYAALGQALAEADASGETWQTIEAVKLIALTGCRRNEIVKLKWSEIDSQARCLRLSDSKEGPSTRPLGKAARALIERLKRSDDFVFPAVLRGHGAFGGIAGGWRRLVRRAGLQGATLHVLRHSFASTADDLGLTMATTASLLGHAIGGTTGRYVHKPDALLLAAADKVAAFVHDAMTSGAASVEDEKRLLQAFVAEPWDTASAPERNGRPAEPDDKLLWEMALLRADRPSLSHREAAKETLANFSPGEHSEDGAVDRLRKKYGKCADLLEDAVAHIQHNLSAGI